MLNRHQIREKLVFSMYQHLLLKKTIDECFKANFASCDDDFALTIINDLQIKEDVYIKEISGYLKDWTFDRLSFVEQGILLVATSEIKQKLNDKAVVIDEAIRITKSYSDEASYKYINGVLDKL